MEKSLVIVLKDLNNKLDKTNLEVKKRTKYRGVIKTLIGKYGDLEISDNHIETYESLVSKGRELLKNNIKDEDKLKYYIGYCEAALYDFEGKMKPLSIIIRMFVISCAIFLVLAPQYFGFIFPLIFIVPIYLGLKGMKKRVVSGLKLGLSVMPMALMTSVVYLRMLYLESKDFQAFLVEQSRMYTITEAFARNLTFVFGGLAIVLLLSSISTIYMGVKYRKMFV